MMEARLFCAMLEIKGNLCAANVTFKTLKEEIYCMMIGEMRYLKNVFEEQQWMPSGQ
jgi:hypothetical protein